MGIGLTLDYVFFFLGSLVCTRACVRLCVCVYVFFCRPKGNGLIDTHPEIVNQT